MIGSQRADAANVAGSHGDLPSQVALLGLRLVSFCRSSSEN
jgi:hypothetical protein